LLKLKDFSKAIVECQKALEKDDQNIKALFRLGQAHCGCSEFEEAIAVLKRAIELAPEDANLKREVQVVQKAQVAFRQKERKMYSNMFG
jgi:tetratricopeptide (TPR) repeat protein